MKLDITIPFKMTVMGGAAYIFSQYARINSQRTIVIWMAAELAGQIFALLNQRLGFFSSFRDSTICSIAVSGSVGVGGMLLTKLVNNVSHPIIVFYGFSIALALTSLLLKFGDYQVRIISKKPEEL